MNGIQIERTPVSLRKLALVSAMVLSPVFMAACSEQVPTAGGGGGGGGGGGMVTFANGFPANTNAGSFNVSVQIADFATESFTVGAEDAEYVQRAPGADGFTTYGTAALAEGFKPVGGVTDITIADLPDDTCVIIHDVASDPTVADDVVDSTAACP